MAYTKHNYQSGNRLYASQLNEMDEQIAENSGIVQDSDTGADLDVCDEEGNTLLRISDGHIQLKDFNSSTACIEKGAVSSADLDITDDNGNVILQLENGHIKTKNFDSEKLPGGIIDRNADINDIVYASCRYNQPKLNSKDFCMLVAGDIHEDAARLGNMVEYLNGIDALDCGIMLGDIAGTNWNSDTTFYTNGISKSNKPFLTVIGNHDAGSTTSTDTSYTNVSDLYDKLIAPNIRYAQLSSTEHTSGNTYYYKDFSDYGIRIIVLNQYDYPADTDSSGNLLYRRGYPLYSQEQINWFITTLNSTPSNYGVIVAIHSLPARLVVDHDDPWTATSSYTAYNTMNPESYVDGYIIPEIVSAWISGTTLTKTYNLTVTGTWTSLSVSANFSARGTGEFIAYFGGHWHQTVFGTCHENASQHIVVVDCAGLNSSVQGDTPRKKGTKSEDSIISVSVDRTNRAVNMVRIGAHYTNTMKDRLVKRFEY